MKSLKSVSFGLPPVLSGAEESKAITDKATAKYYESDCNYWLPAAAKVYNISPRLQDYVLIPVPALITELPNTNGDSVSAAELVKFDHRYGCLAFKTFKGKPLFIEHDHNDHTRAKGVILDSYLTPLKRFKGNHYKLSLLLAFDTTRDPVLTTSILNGESNAYSVGYFFRGYVCSYCGKRSEYASNGKILTCAHTKPEKAPYIRDGKLVYRKCYTITGFECSSVVDPAFISAIGPSVLKMQY
jgi:hypothetical protein